MNDVMVDLETLGRRAGCAILSIGAVGFDPETGELGERHYQVIRLKSCLDLGLHVDDDTMDWWERQSVEAKKVLTQARAGRGNKILRKALIEFNEFLATFGGHRKVKVWGNGADFDNAILISCYAAAEVPTGWDFWNGRCYRTLKNLNPSVKLARSGTYHNALDDAVSQAEHALEIFKAMQGKRRVRAK